MTSKTRLLTKSVVVGGCGRTGAALTAALCESGSAAVYVLDMAPSSFDRLAPDLVRSRRARARLADVTLASSLRAARAQDADIFISVTGDDTVNAMAAQIARHIFRVSTVVCRMDDPIKRDMYRDLEIVAVSQAEFIHEAVVEIVRNGGTGA